MIKTTKLLKVTAATMVCAFASIASAEDYADYPSQSLNFTIAFGPGGGNDTMVRSLVEVIRKYELYPEDIIIRNREGGSGAIGWSYVNQQAGNPYHITSTSGNFIGTPLVSNTDWNYESFTPVGLLANDALVIAVAADSEFSTLEDFVNEAKNRRVTIGGIGAAGPDRVVAGLLQDSAGITLEYVPQQDGGQLLTSLTSGSVDAVLGGPSEVAGQVDAGNFRILAYSENTRSNIYPEIPTFVEQGYDVVFSLPRGVMLPADVPEHTQQWWIDTLQTVIQTPEWQEGYLQRNGLSGNPIWGEEFADYLDDTNSKFESTLREIGAIR
ncbi:Bug family tripartite tricarboxylate transporter substrate binding protein [Saccharospirillum alexandrii]|uniref:Bug family tripartite tricarboxylate transporter substrate binding protein n=1 Tax=Saccharospirillum alexandrii TaxID=2448477 RepID=UPI000FD75E1D|nr:tripartite tricarboxylate transporter substrate binding protein [Saccharospirillum alexandrii]